MKLGGETQEVQVSAETAMEDVDKGACELIEDEMEQDQAQKLSTLTLVSCFAFEPWGRPAFRADFLE
jgi:hypothetical protein